MLILVREDNKLMGSSRLDLLWVWVNLVLFELNPI